MNSNHNSELNRSQDMSSYHKTDHNQLRDSNMKLIKDQQDTILCKRIALTDDLPDEVSKLKYI